MSFYITLHEQASTIQDLQKKIMKQLTDFGLNQHFTAEIINIELCENQAVKTRVAVAQTKLVKQIEKQNRKTQVNNEKKIRQYTVKTK